MTLAPNTDFTTTDPQQLRVDLQVEHRDIVREFSAIGDPMPRWTVVLVGEGQTVRAQANGFYIGSGFTVYTPGKPDPGTVFRVCEAGLLNTQVLTDDGTLIMGVPPPNSIGGGARGWFEYVYAASPVMSNLAGWWRNR